MKSSSAAINLLLTLTLASAAFGVQARQAPGPAISDFWLTVLPPAESGPTAEPGVFGLQIIGEAILRYDIATGEIVLGSGDDVIANGATVPDRIFFDRFQLEPQDRSGLYNPLVCFDLQQAAPVVGIRATDVNDHTVIDEFSPAGDLVYDLANKTISFQAPGQGACFYRPYQLGSDRYGEFGLFGDAQADSGGLSIQYDVPSSVVQGGTLNYERIITNASGEPLDVFFQEVFPANPSFFTSASFAGTESQVRGVVPVPDGQSDPSGPVSRSVAVENVEPGQYLDLYFAAAALDASGNILAASEHRRVLVTAADAGFSDLAVDRGDNVVADGVDSATLTVTVRDSQSQLVEGQEVHLAITAGDPGDGGLSASTMMSGSNGTVQASLTSTNADTVSVSAYLGSSDQGPLVSTVNVTFVPGAAAALSVSSGTASLESGSDQTLSVEVVDANGNLVSDDTGRTISFEQSSGSGSVTGLADVTSASGQASLIVTGNAAGPVTLTASATGLDDGATEFTVVPGPVAELAFIGTVAELPSSTSADLTVELRDGQGNPILADPGLEVTFSQVTGSGAVTGLGTATSSGGTASIGVTGTTAGPVEIQASANAVIADTTSFNVVPGVAIKLVFISGEQDLVIGQTRDLVAQVQDANDNLVASAGGFVDFRAVFDPNGGEISLLDGTNVIRRPISGGLANLLVEGLGAGPVTVTIEDADSNRNLSLDSTTFSVIE
ncbi:MAG: invasin domain 3-containing protein [Wenzhouxiangella sp.]|nr:invasin domain 3-containing protein [Wenzhouxiangella sp.]